MAKLENYRNYIREIIDKYSQIPASVGDIENQTIFDKEHDHYQLVRVGWRNQKRVLGSIFHIDIKNGKIWIQHDGTDIGIANKLLEYGVPKEDIVLAFHPPYKRQYTDFAVG